MAKKPKLKPIEQGSLAAIYRHFFGAMGKHKPEQMSERDWMELLFNLKTRDIVQYECTHVFDMPGIYYAAASVKIQGIGYRRVEPPTLLWARFDSTQPDLVQVEWQGGQGNKDQVFALTQSEWGYAKRFLVEKEKERK